MSVGKPCSLILLVFLILVALTALTETAPSRGASGELVPAVIISPSTMPQVIESAALQSDEGRQLTFLTYTIKNSAAADVQNFAMAVYLLNSFGYITAGEGWNVRTLLPKGSTREFTEPLGHYVAFGHKLVVVLTGAQTSESSWRVEGNDVLRSIRQRFPLSSTSSAGNLKPAVSVTSQAR